MMIKEYEKAFNSFDYATLVDTNQFKAFERAADALRELGRGSTADEYAKRAKELKTDTN